MSRDQVIPSALLNERTPASLVITAQICVLTYKRPDLLRSTLESLICQHTYLNSINFQGNLQIQVLVIDNDSSNTGYSVVEDLRAGSSFPLKYVSEPTRGIANARNRALQESSSADFVAFIDDDETADVNWLIYLVDAALEFNADIVTGPVHPQYHDSPSWIKRGKFFESQHRRSGSRIPFVATNNVLLRANIVKNFRFDRRFDSTGGEDTEFFIRASRAGHHAVWAGKAAVTEYIPQERTTLRWILDRARSDANRYTRSCLSSKPTKLSKVRRLLVATGGFLAGAAQMPGLVFGRHHAARGLQLIFRSIGTIGALRGHADIYYKASND